MSHFREERFKLEINTYRIVQFEENEPVVLYYWFQDHTTEWGFSPWKYCGDHDTIEDAKKYAEKRDSLLANGDTVML